MPGIARKDGKDDVKVTGHGQGNKCKTGIISATKGGSSKVFVKGVGVVTLGAPMKTHKKPGCIDHAPTLSIGSPNVFAEGKKIGRYKDKYGEKHEITSDCETVFANGGGSGGAATGGKIVEGTCKFFEAGAPVLIYTPSYADQPPRCSGRWDTFLNKFVATSYWIEVEYGEKLGARSCWITIRPVDVYTPLTNIVTKTVSENGAGSPILYGGVTSRRTPWDPPEGRIDRTVWNNRSPGANDLLKSCSVPELKGIEKPIEIGNFSLTTGGLLKGLKIDKDTGIISGWGDSKSMWAAWRYGGGWAGPSQCQVPFSWFKVCAENYVGRTCTDKIRLEIWGASKDGYMCEDCVGPWRTRQWRKWKTQSFPGYSRCPHRYQ